MSAPAEACVIFVTIDTAEHAGEIAQTIVGERLAACVNIVPGLRSIYRWKGEVQDDAELLMIVKSTAPRFEALCKRISELHPYDVPEIIALPVDRGFPPYLDWVIEQTAAEG